jgi:hypothetical protein
MNAQETQFEKLAEAQLSQLRESHRAEYGFDPEEVWSNVDNPRFSLRKTRESLKARLREAVSETAFAQLVRYGVQRMLIGAYKQVPTIYQNIHEQVASKTLEEMYAPMYGVDVPVAVKDGEPSPESRLAGLERRIQNHEYARILAISKRLVQDDQTGQIKRIAGTMGQRMKYAEEKASIGTFVANIPSTEFCYGTNVAGQASGTTAGQLTQPSLEAAWSAFASVEDPLGQLALVNPDTVVIAKSDEINARRILQSPQITQVAAAGSPGSGFMADNILKELGLKIEASQFVASARAGIDTSYNPWILCEAKKSDVFQNRTALEVVQEDPNSGDSFKNREYRYQMDRRFGSGPVDYLFKFIGN